MTLVNDYATVLDNYLTQRTRSCGHVRQFFLAVAQRPEGHR
jgi:hypothetical protein